MGMYCRCTVQLHPHGNLVSVTFLGAHTQTGACAMYLIKEQCPGIRLGIEIMGVNQRAHSLSSLMALLTCLSSTPA